MWSQNWGEMVWGTVAVPGLAPWGLLLLGMAIPTAGWLLARRLRGRSLAAALLLGIVVVPVAAWAAVTLPHSFTNGTAADADEVNANFAALVAAVEANQARLDQIDQMFLTTNACPAGYTAVEDGYVRLGGTGLTIVPSTRTLEAPAHYLGVGTLATGLEGNHRHTYYDYHYLDSGGPEPNYATPTGDDVGIRTQTYRSPGTNPGTPHNHSVSGLAGNTAGSDGDANLAVAGELEHVLLRLCVKN